MNAKPIPMTPQANLRGVVGARLPSLVHMIANTGDRAIAQIGSMEPIQLGAFHPRCSNPFGHRNTPRAR